MNASNSKPIVYVFQIGYGKWGKIAFKKFLQISTNLDDVNLIMEGVCDINQEARKKLKVLLDEKRLSTKIFSSTKEMYDYASEFSNVLIFDSSQSELHSSHIIKSLEHNFYHLAEKPPYFSIKEKEMIKKTEKVSKVKWSCDLIEFLNPVVKEAKKFLTGKKIKIDNIDVFRLNSIGIKKILQGDHRYGVQGGCLLDKAIHDGYIFDFSDGKPVLLDAVADFFMIDSLKDPKILDLRLKPFSNGEPSLAQGCLKGKIGEINFSIYSGWLGIPLELKKRFKRIGKISRKNFIFSKEAVVNNKKFLDEELRLFVISGKHKNVPIEIYGDMKHFQLLINENGKWRRIEMEKEDQLYKILTNAVLVTANKRKFLINEREINKIMNIIFDSMKRINSRSINIEKEKEKTERYVKNKLL